jgi:hypothetical protein
MATQNVRQISGTVGNIPWKLWEISIECLSKTAKRLVFQLQDTTFPSALKCPVLCCFQDGVVLAMCVWDRIPKLWLNRKWCQTEFIYLHFSVRLLWACRRAALNSLFTYRYCLVVWPWTKWRTIRITERERAKQEKQWSPSSLWKTRRWTRVSVTAGRVTVRFITRSHTSMTITSCLISYLPSSWLNAGNLITTVFVHQSHHVMKS